MQESAKLNYNVTVNNNPSSRNSAVRGHTQALTQSLQQGVDLGLGAISAELFVPSFTILCLKNVHFSRIVSNHVGFPYAFKDCSVAP